MTRTGPFQLLIFDCDGVLVDSELLSNRVLAEMANELGLPLTAEEALVLFKGCKFADCLATVAKQLGRPLPEDFLPAFRARSFEAFRSQLQPIPGIHQALEQLSYPMCVASSGPPEKISLALSVVGLLSRFQEHIFSSYEIQSWKPEPDLFLHAAAAFGISPQSCAVIEDSTLGVRAGIAAGMTVFAYTTHGEAAEFEELGATVFHRMEELPGLLAVAERK